MVQKEGQSHHKHVSRFFSLQATCIPAAQIKFKCLSYRPTSEKLSVRIVSSTRADSDSDAIFSLKFRTA